MEIIMRNLVCLLTILFTVLSVAIGVQAQCNWEETQKLIAPDRESFDYFGYSVSIDGNVMVVGSIGDDDGGIGSGSVYVFRYDPGGSGWMEEAKLVASDGESGDDFGDAVSISNDVIAVGAWGDDDNGVNSGSAYVFRYDGTNWMEEAKILPSNGKTHEGFGDSISINGDSIVAGSTGDEDNGGSAGAAYVFRYDGSDWVEESKLLASDGDIADYFGWSVAIDGETAVVGTWADDDNGLSSGSAYVFRYDGSDWIEETKLLASDGDDTDYYGYSVSLDGDVIIVGAKWDEDYGPYTGSAYVYRFDGSQWVEDAKLLPPDGDAGAAFGCSVSIDGDAIVVGAWADKINGVATGSAYAFQYEADESRWTERGKMLASDGAYDDHFGFAVSVSDNMVIIGASEDDDFDSNYGSVYVYDLTQCVPTLSISPDPLIAGQDATFAGTNLIPNELSYLAYSLGGLGNTYVPQLNITLDLAQAIRVKTMKSADSTGYAFVNLSIPPQAFDLDIWFQGCQYDLKTNVVATHIE